MKALEITVTGLVQGVGYRPFVAELAEELGIVGQVKNVGGIVKIIASSHQEALDDFVERLKTFYPEGARVENVAVVELGERGEAMNDSESNWGLGIACDFSRFTIVSSNPGTEDITLIPADLATCEKCEAEMKDTSNRRYRYPFISCVSCGPRFSIIDALPYDRDTITMDDFKMCPECEKEYLAKGNRRRHAQTIACKDCGPRLHLFAKDLDLISREETSGKNLDDEILEKAIALLQEGKIGAIKDIGGFHFAFLPTLTEPARRLRDFKNREKKPFAVMFPSVDEVKKYCYVSEQEEEILTQSARPIVLLKKKNETLPNEKCFAIDICGESDRIGVLLPCNPLQILLVEALGPLVMTSGNRGGEPIITEDEPMKVLFEQGCPDFVLTHDRRILTPLEDSIMQVVKTGDREIVQILRRGRGFVPEPIFMNRTLHKEAFAAGGDLKAAFALGKKNAVYMSSHFGDLVDYRALKKREESIAHMRRLLSIKAEESVGDLHPLYVSSEGVNKKFQHHQAHLLSAMAEQGLDEAIGFVFDGTGFGTNGSIWGGEFLYAKGNELKRLGHLKEVLMAGSDEGAKNGLLSLLAFYQDALEKAYLSQEEYDLAVEKIKADERLSGQLQILEAMRKNHMGLVPSSSMGRLFDAVAALLEIKNYNSYEGECAIALEIAAHRALEAGKSELEVVANISDFLYKEEDEIIFDSSKLMIELWRLKESGMDTDCLALAFHRVIVQMLVAMLLALRKEHKDLAKLPVALTGGTFFNRILLKESMERLKEQGFDALTNEKVPCGDGGLALGQIYALTFE